MRVCSTKRELPSVVHRLSSVVCQESLQPQGEQFVIGVNPSSGLLWRDCGLVLSVGGCAYRRKRRLD
jgi:hypothetical protein